VIAFARSVILEHVLEPQQLEERGELRAFLDPEAMPLDTRPQEIDLLNVTTRPGSFEIGNGLTLRHEISVGIAVAHGDRVEGRRLLDGIVLELCLRALDSWDEIGQEVDPASGQYVTALTWAIDWRPLPLDTPNESATITFSIDTQLDR
jgi:hypothetical protein